MKPTPNKTTGDYIPSHPWKNDQGRSISPKREMFDTVLQSLAIFGFLLLAYLYLIYRFLSEARLQ